MKKIILISILILTMTACNNLDSDTNGEVLEFSDQEEPVNEIFVSKEVFDMNQKFEDGEYLGETVGEAESRLVVKTVIKDGEISEINIVEHKETPGISDKTLEDIPRNIVEKNSVNSIDMYTGASLTGERIVSAVVKCLEQAVKN